MKTNEWNLFETTNTNSRPSTNPKEGPGQTERTQIALRHPVGEKLRLKVGRVVPYGFFAELEPGTGFDALCHVSQIRGLDGRSPQEVFRTGMIVDCTVSACNITMDRVRVQLAGEVPSEPAPEAAPQGAGVPVDLHPLVAGLIEIATREKTLLPLLQACLRTGKGLAGCAEADIEQWLAGNRAYALGLFDNLKAFAKEMPNTRSLLGSLFGLKGGASGRNTGEWMAEHPQDSERAREWLAGLVRERPIHVSLLGELTRRFGVPKPATAWVSRFPEFAVLAVANSPIRQPAVALRERLEDPQYWGQFATKLPPEACQGPEEAPAAGAEGATEGAASRILVDGSNYIRSDMGVKGLESILEALKASGRAPFSIFDAATPYNVDEDGKALIQRLIEAGEATLAPGGTTADAHLLLLADKCGCDIVSNDMFRDWEDKYPWLAKREGEGKRVHTAMSMNGMILIPDLGICAPVLQ